MNRSEPSPAVEAQAAAWLARLCSEERSSSDQAAFQTWIGERPEHREAFDRMTTAWEMAGATRNAFLRAAPRKARGGSLRTAAAVGAGLVTAAVAAVMILLPRAEVPDSFQTRTGEQRRVALADGSTMLLDAETVVEVSLSARSRQVRVAEGRAHFDVAKDEARPFVVAAGDRHVIAVGTRFDVFYSAGLTSVVLTQGKVLVEGGGDRRLMAPGERVSFNHDGVVVDRPSVETVTAWQSGQAVFENERLGDAVAELNRYSRRPLVIADGRISDMRISGSYRLGDNQAFATSLSALLPIKAERAADRITLRLRSAGAAG